MHTKMLEEATHEQLKSFLMDQFDELKRTMPEIYEDMEEKLYEHIHGPHFTGWKYDCAVSKLVNRDGTKGAHWSVAQVSDLAKSKGVSLPNYNQYDVAYVMNMLYSDYYGVVGDNAELYLRMTAAFLNDPDAPEGKAFKYYESMH